MKKQFMLLRYRRHMAASGLVLCAVLATALVLFACTSARIASADPTFNKPYLTWQDDPSTTMTVNYHSPEALETVTVVYGPESAAEHYPYLASGNSWQIPGLPDARHINSVELTALEPGRKYYFRIKDGNGYSPEYAFRTVPAADEPLRFVTGGDTLPTHVFRELLEHVAASDPMFLVIGGDLAYADGSFEKVDRWNQWFEIWHEFDTTSDGRLIPLVMGIGNHETNRLEGTHEIRAPFYFGFFPQGGKPYFAHRIGANLGLIVLDSGHLVPHAEQVPWLEEQLERFAELPFRAAVYHVPLYPSFRDFEGGASVAGRTHWLPLFDAYRLSVGFENHDHTFKRTIRLRNNEADPAGTIYVGDGNAGVMPRQVREDLWYTEKVSRDSHFWVVDVNAAEMRLRAINRQGEVFDEAVVEARTIAAP